VKSYDVKDLGGPNTHEPEKYGREAAFLGIDTVYNDWSQSRGDAVHGTACLDSGATLFLFKSDYNPSLIAPEKATANIHGYGANMTQTGDLKGKTFITFSMKMTQALETQLHPWYDYGRRKWKFSFSVSDDGRT
jgi:hypothetical protein